jgi:Calcium/calmodulin dependent protein kinase II association domain
VGGVPNPDADGVWFFIDFHRPDSQLQIDSQAVVPPYCFGDKLVLFVILEGKKTKSVEISDMRIRWYGDTALVTGLATRKDTAGGKARDFQYYYTRVWILRDGRWQCVHMQSTTTGTLGGLSK